MVEAIRTFDELKSAVGDFLDDATVPVALCIQLAESEMRDRLLGLGRSEVRAIATLSDERSAMPTDVGSMVSLRLNTSPVRLLRWVDPNAFNAELANLEGAAGPVIYTVVGSEFRFAPAPAPGSEYVAELIYRQDIRRSVPPRRRTGSCSAIPTPTLRRP
jgi:hypothetical protein